MWHDHNGWKLTMLINITKLLETKNSTFLHGGLSRGAGVACAIIKGTHSLACTSHHELRLSSTVERIWRDSGERDGWIDRCPGRLDWLIDGEMWCLLLYYVLWTNPFFVSSCGAPHAISKSPHFISLPLSSSFLYYIHSLIFKKFIELQLLKVRIRLTY